MRMPRLLHRLSSALLLGGTLITITSAYLLFGAPLLTTTVPYRFVIPYASSTSEVYQQLYPFTRLHTRIALRLAACCLRYHKPRPGHYSLAPQLSAWQAVRQLRAGNQTPVQLTFSQAQNLNDLLDQITNRIGITSDAVRAYLEHPQWLATHGFTKHDVLALFVPDTYEVYWTTCAKALLARFYQAYQRFWTHKRRMQAHHLGLTPNQVVTLAAIVQAESLCPEEASLIAGVYLNRLRKGMRLQADPTLKYALGDPTRKRLLKQDKCVTSRYNTYLHRGLPPGPVLLPTQINIDAVLRAKKHKYLYFVAKEDLSGKHHFTTHLLAHNRHAQRYRRALDRAKIYR